MRRISTVVTLCLLLVASLALPAHAESQTVEGQGDIEKMRARNGDSAVVVKLFGLNGPCEVRDFTIEIRWGTDERYEVQAGCYGGTTWAENLYYLADKDNPESAQEVNCRRFKVTYNEDRGIHRAFVPRSCLDEATNRVRVYAEGVNYGGMGGTAGPTRRLARG